MPMYTSQGYKQLPRICLKHKHSQVFQQHYLQVLATARLKFYAHYKLVQPVKLPV